MFYATGFMGYFILTFIIGFGAIMLVGANPVFKDAAGQLIGGNNMAAVHLAGCGGGNLCLRFILRGRLRHHSGGGRWFDAGGRLSGVARPVRQRLP